MDRLGAVQQAAASSTGTSTPWQDSQSTTANASTDSLALKQKSSVDEEPEEDKNEKKKQEPILPIESLNKLREIKDERGGENLALEAAIAPVDHHDDDPSVGEFPEGGWEAWGCLFGTWWMNFFTFGAINSFGVYEAYYADHMLPNNTVSQIAWIGAFQYFAVFGLGIVAGRLFDLGYMRPTLGVSTVMLVFFQLMTSLCTEYWQLFLAQGVGLGIAMGFVIQICIAVPSHWFKKRRATAMGILASGGGAGGTIQPIFVKRVIPLVGFAWTMRIIALSAAVVLLGCFFLIKTRLPCRPAKVNSRYSWLDLGAFRMKSFSFFAVGAAIIMLGIYTPLIYMNTFTAFHKIPGDGYWLSVLNAASILGRLVPGLLADRYGNMTVLIPHALIATVLLFLFPLFDNTSIAAFAIIYGYCSGCYISLAPICVNQLGPTSSVGSRVGALFSCLSIAGLFGSPLAGLIMGSNPYHWWATVAYSGGCLTLGLAFILVSRHYAARQLSTRP